MQLTPGTLGVGLKIGSQNRTPPLPESGKTDRDEPM